LRLCGLDGGGGATAVYFKLIPLSRLLKPESLTRLPNNADLDNTWAFLAASVDDIMTKLATELSFSRYMSL
jgi:hypothetical protein